MELLAKGLAHDFQNLLLPVATVLEITKPKLSEPEQQLHLIATNNLSFVRSWLAEAINVGMLRSMRQATTTRTLVAAACSNIRELAEAKRINISTTVPMFRIEVDIALCTRAIAHLLENAIEASAAGAIVRIEVARPSPKVMQMRVIDTGPGIDDAHRDHIGRPFFTTQRGHGRTRGFGLGLVYCQQVALLHGGELRHKNGNRGATFVFSLRCD